MKTNYNTIELKNQHKGFLKMPHVLRPDSILEVDAFETNNIQPIKFHIEDVKAFTKHLYLGKRAELFMLSYLKKQQNLTKVMHSIQIQNEKTTLGEIDFLFYNKTLKKWIHLELVTKFYIYNSNDPIENHLHWIGPNLKDKFVFKLDKLKNHQLQLLKLPEARSRVMELGIDPNKIITQFCYKAKLFLPADLTAFEHKVTNPNCVCGTYFNLDDFKQLEFDPYLYYVPEKLNWVISPNLHSHWYSFDKAKEIVKSSLNQKRSCLLWRKTPDGEYLEDFVVWWS